ncbi:uncharacterized protein DUF4154 [Nitrosomonas ureae]|nr:uncharacterized protein DUF4154 [Nitrosomonas ureae]
MVFLYTKTDLQVIRRSCRKIRLFLKSKYVTLNSKHKLLFYYQQPSLFYLALIPLSWLLILSYSPMTYAEQPTEYRMKVAFLYNFAAYTEWPDRHGQDLNLCIYGDNPFGEHLQHLQQKKINGHEIIIRHTKNINDLSNCQMIFITQSVIGNLDDIIMLSHERPILTVADTPGTASQGIMLNMAVKEGKITFEANIITAKNSGLRLSSQLLRFASKVYQ